MKSFIINDHKMYAHIYGLFMRDCLMYPYSVTMRINPANRTCEFVTNNQNDETFIREMLIGFCKTLNMKFHENPSES